jgi:hypothetical protein
VRLNRRAGHLRFRCQRVPAVFSAAAYFAGAGWNGLDDAAVFGVAGRPLAS